MPTAPPIEETTQVQPVPVTTIGPISAPPQTITAKADPTRNYVASNPLYDYGLAQARALPYANDDLTRDFGTRIWDQMDHDAQVTSSLDAVVYGTLAKELRMAVELEEDDPDYDQARLIHDFCMWNLSRLTTPIMQVLQELVREGLKTGHKVAEQVYEYATWGQTGQGQEAGPKLVLKKLRTIPNEAKAFVTDAFYDELGIIYTRYGSMSAALLGADGVIPGLIPRSKFAIFCWKAQNGDPRGSSILRSIYAAWWLKEQAIPLTLKFLARFAQPAPVGTLAENASPVTTDALGNPLTTPLSAGSVMLTELVKYGDGAAIAMPFGSKLELKEAMHEGQAFQMVLDYVDRQIAKGILLTSRATMESKHGSKADSQTAQDMSGLLGAFVQLVVENMVRQDILRPLVLYNFGEDAAARLLPRVMVGAVESQDFGTFTIGIAALLNSGFAFTDEQILEIDTALGFKPRDIKKWNAQKAAQEAEAQQQAQDIAQAKQPVQLPTQQPTKQAVAA